MKMFLDRTSSLDQHFCGKVHVLICQMGTNQVLSQILILVKACQKLLKTCQV